MKRLCLIPSGQSENTGIEGFTPYINLSINYYQFTEDSALYALNNLLFSHTMAKSVLIHATSVGCTKIHKAIDIHVWRNFSRLAILAGGFYQWMDGPYGPISKKPEGDLQPLDIYGGCAELKVVIIRPISFKVRGAWDSNNGRRISYALQLEMLTPQNNLYQPVRRYMMPVQYDSPHLDTFAESYEETEDEVMRLRQMSQGLPANRVQELA
jgi:hypothetical protein